MSATLRKIVGDLRERPIRTAMVGVAIALSVTLVVAAFIATSVLTRELDSSFLRSRPPHIVLVRSALTEADERMVGAADGVAAVARRRVIRGRVRTDAGEWQTLILSVVPSLDRSPVSAFTALSTVSPNGTNGTLLVERSSLSLMPMDAGDPLQLRFSGRQTVSARVSGFAHDGGVAPGWQDRVVYAYATSETVWQWGIDASYDELHVLADPGQDVRALARGLRDGMTARGMPPTRVELPPRVHPHADQMGAVLALVAAFAAVGLVIGTTLMATMILAMLRSQARQIAIMKAMGASVGRLRTMFVAMASVVALPAAAVACGAGLLAGRAFVAFAASELNLDGVDLEPRLWVVACAATLGVAVPIGVAWMVCGRALSLTVLQGLREGQTVRSTTVLPLFNSGPANRLYAWRNVWRQPVRVALAAVALALGGASLMTAGHVNRSLVAAVDRAFTYRLDDGDVRLVRPVAVAQLRQALGGVAGVRALEMWGGGLGVVSYDDGTTSTRYGFLAPPLNTALLTVPASEGHWLTADPHPAFVVTRNLLAKEPSLSLGHVATLQLQGRSVTATLVGVVDEVSEPCVYLSPAAYGQLTGGGEDAGVLRFQATGAPDGVMKDVDEALFQAGVTPALLFDRDTLRRSTTDHFVILLVILGVIAACALLVGGLGLATSNSVTMLERRREIGVLRTLGATDRTVLRLCALESSVLVTGAVVAAVALALVMSAGLESVLSRHALHVAIPFTVATEGILAWLAVATATAALSVWVPLKSSLRTPAREALVVE